ncbi:MAG: hypothetical protein GMKNLPBB_01996 [Myxococcota bacterium]|nr:hypothetical protein [Myxococcota bacterium]
MRDAEQTGERTEKNTGDVLVDDFHIHGEPFHRVRRERRVVLSVTPPPPEPGPVHRPAKVARMLALAHHLQRAIDRGDVANRAAVARKLGLTRARVTQLLDLLLLAPDLQMAVLRLEAIDGAEPMAERTLRAVAHAGTWAEQREAWARCRAAWSTPAHKSVPTPA